MPAIYVKVPDDLKLKGFVSDDRPLKPTVEKLVNEHQGEMPPYRLPTAGTGSTIWVSASVHAKLSSYIAPPALESVGDVATQLLIHSFVQYEAETTNKVHQKKERTRHAIGALSKVYDAFGMNERTEQVQFSRVLSEFLDKPQTHQVLMAEAGTGVGKTLGYLCVVADYLKKHKTATCMVAAPSFALLNQIVREWETVTKALPHLGQPLVLMGQGEFVSSTALEMVLDNMEEDDAAVRTQVQEWIMRGAPAAPDSYLKSKWTMNGLLAAVPEFAYSKDVVLAERIGDEDDGYQAYKQQFESLIRAPSLVICTHAMLAILAKRRQSQQTKALQDDDAVDLQTTIDQWKALPLQEKKDVRLYEIINSAILAHAPDVGLDILPDIDLLILDEGHQFEDAVHNVCSRSASMTSLKGAAWELHKAHPKAFGVPNALEAIFAQFSGLNAADDEVLNMQEHKLNGTPLLSLFADVLATTVTPKSSASKKAIADAKSTSEWRYLSSMERAVRLANSLAQRTEAVGAVLHWSPTKKWPRVHVGRHSVAKELDYIWCVVAQRTIIVSGTIYDSIPTPNCENLRRSLSIPYEQMVTMQPIHAQWQIDPVTMCMVKALKSPDGRERFCRPRRNNGTGDPVAHAAWLEDVSRYTLDAYGVGHGGMLVVGTAYADIDAIAQQFKRIYPDVPLLQQKAKVPLLGLRERFLELSRQGQRPVLLGVGAAWTGLDIYAPDAPDALTDLVILNAPFGVVNRTLSRMIRMASRTGNFEISSAVTRLVRQVVGRLVRSPDTPNNRRIHWLDARIYQPSLAGMLMPVRRVLERYKRLDVG